MNSFFKSQRKYLFFVCVLTFVLRFFFASLFGNEVADINSYRNMANYVLQHKNIYDSIKLFPYSPLFIFIYPLILISSVRLNIPFHLMIKTPIIFADVGIVYLLYQIGYLKGGVRSARIFSLLYCINPVSILVSAFHGNIIILSVFFSLLSYYILLISQNIYGVILSGLVLGLAVGWRNYPILLLPLFIKKIIPLKHKVLFFVMVIIPVLSAFILFLPFSLNQIIHEVFKYDSVIDHGWLAIARLYFLKKGLTPSLLPYLMISKIIFLVLYLMLVCYYFLSKKNESLVKYIVIVFLLFYTVFGGIASQYFTWVLPFLMIFNLHTYLVFSTVVTIGILSFYAYFFPWLIINNYPLLWKLREIIDTKINLLNIYFGAVVFCWIVLAINLLKLTLSKFNNSLETQLTSKVNHSYHMKNINYRMLISISGIFLILILNFIFELKYVQSFR